MPTVADITVVGGGIVGLATAKAFVAAGLTSVRVLEAEPKLARHQTGNNSGVIHSGIYYKPGSAKARNCAEGRELLYRYAQEQGIAHERCGKVIVASDASELGALAEIERRGLANGLQGMTRLTAEELREHEPHVAGIAGLFVRETGIIDYQAVTDAYAQEVRHAGGEVLTDTRVVAVQRDHQQLQISTTQGDFTTRYLVNCAGLQSDRIAKMCGIDPGVKIVPFRGEYYELVPERCHLVKHLIYPVPDPRFPFLGVHFTRMIHGGIEAGPNAVLAFKREGYRFRDFSMRDMLELAGYSGFWKMAGKFWYMGLMEMKRSLSHYSFWQALRKLVPEVQYSDIVRAGAGVRAQAVGPDGKLVDDFHIRGESRMIHVLNAPSPAATASISIGQSIAELARNEFGLNQANSVAA